MMSSLFVLLCFSKSCVFECCFNWNESSPTSWEDNVSEKWFNILKMMWVQKLKFEVGVNSEVEQHSVSFLEDLDFTLLLLSRRKQICLFSVWIRKGEGLKKRNTFSTSCFLTQVLHKFFLGLDILEQNLKENGKWRVNQWNQSYYSKCKIFREKKEKLMDKLITVQSRTCDKYVGF